MLAGNPLLVIAAAALRFAVFPDLGPVFRSAAIEHPLRLPVRD